MGESTPRHGARAYAPRPRHIDAPSAPRNTPTTRVSQTGATPMKRLLSMAGLALAFPAGVAAQGEPFSMIPVAGTPTQVAVGDANADGKLDFVVGLSGAFQVHLGDGSGGFPTNSFISSPATGGVALADFDGDGIADVVQGYGNATKLAFFHGNGTAVPSFTGPTDSTVQTRGKELAPTNLNN